MDNKDIISLLYGERFASDFEKFKDKAKTIAEDNEDFFSENEHLRNRLYNFDLNSKKLHIEEDLPKSIRDEIMRAFLSIFG